VGLVCQGRRSHRTPIQVRLDYAKVLRNNRSAVTLRAPTTEETSRSQRRLAPDGDGPDSRTSAITRDIEG